MRLIHAVRELNEQRDEPIVLIALFTEAERHAMFVREADEAVCLGPALPTARRSGYLDHGALERALVAARADAAWVGWGFVAEDPGVRRPVRAARDRLRRAPSRRSCGSSATRSPPSGSPRSAGVPVAPWSGGPVDDGRGRAPPRDADRLPADGQGHGGRRRPRDPPRRRRGRAGRPRFASPAPRPSRPSATARSCWSALRHSGAAHRGAGDRRRPGHRMGARRARLQLPAPPPEGDRGVAPARR